MGFRLARAALRALRGRVGVVSEGEAESDEELTDLPMIEARKAGRVEGAGICAGGEGDGRETVADEGEEFESDVVRLGLGSTPGGGGGGGTRALKSCSERTGSAVDGGTRGGRRVESCFFKVSTSALSEMSSSSFRVKLSIALVAMN